MPYGHGPVGPIAGGGFVGGGVLGGGTVLANTGLQTWSLAQAWALATIGVLFILAGLLVARFAMTHSRAGEG